jgi:hypothetical protein
MNLDHHNDALDRLWAVTRPEEPSPDMFDRIWANVRDRAFEPETLPFKPVAAWKRWGLALAVVAQAAALLIAGFVALRAPGNGRLAQNGAIASLHVDSKADQAAKNAPRPVHEFRLAPGMTFFVNLDGKGLIRDIKEQPQSPQSDIDVVTAESDVLNFMESYE